MNLTNINDLKIGQKVWYYSQYGELLSGKIYELRPNNPHPCGEDFGIYDEVVIKVLKTSSYDGKQFWSNCGICARQTMIYTSEPTKNEFVDERVEFETECPMPNCDGKVEGTGWADDDGIIQKSAWQECIKCDWNQAG